MDLSPQDVKSIAKEVFKGIPTQILAGARWLKLKEAALYSAIGKTRLKALAESPDSPITGFPDPDSKRGDWIFDRESLDAHRILQSNFIHEKALDILKRHGL